MRKSIVLLSIALLAGCATATPIITTSGKKLFFIECKRDSSACIEKANETCPQGYEFVDKLNSQSGIAGSFNANGGFVGTTNRANMTIQCP